MGCSGDNVLGDLGGKWWILLVYFGFGVVVEGDLRFGGWWGSGGGMIMG